MSTAEYQRKWRRWYKHKGNRMVDAEYSRRRLQAMQCMGWSRSAIAQATGIDKSELYHLMNVYKVINVDRLRKVDKAYRQLAYTRAVPRNNTEAGLIRKTLAHAQAMHYVPAMAWDDIDNLREKPKGVRTGKASDSRLSRPFRRD